MVAALVPGADALVGRFRDELDPTARRGLGAHLTLVYPFVEPADVTHATVDALGAAVAPMEPFPCTFGTLRWFGARVLWLAPDPVAPFREIADRIRRHVPGLTPEERELVPAPDRRPAPGRAPRGAAGRRGGPRPAVAADGPDRPRPAHGPHRDVGRRRRGPPAGLTPPDGQRFWTVRARMPSVALSACSEITGKMSRSAHSRWMDDQS